MLGTRPSLRVWEINHGNERAVNPLTRPLLRAIQLSSDLATLAACRLTVWTGKSRVPIHPKHLIRHPAVLWFLPYVREGERILDVGTGIASHARACAARGAWVIGIDHNMTNLRRGQALDVDSAVGLIQGNVEQRLPFRSETFTAILLLDVLEHINGSSAALRECVRVLKPGGWMAVSLPNSETTWKRRYRRAGLPWMNDRDHKREYAWPEIVELLESAGLQIESGPETIVPDTPWKGLVDLLGAISLRLYRRCTEWRVRAAVRRPQESTGYRCKVIKP